MRLNPLMARGAVSQASSSGGSGGLPANRVQLTPAQVQAALRSFAAQDPAYAAFLQHPTRKNLALHVGSLLQVLSPSDDPLTITADILTSR